MSFLDMYIKDWWFGQRCLNMNQQHPKHMYVYQKNVFPISIMLSKNISNLVQMSRLVIIVVSSQLDLLAKL